MTKKRRHSNIIPTGKITRQSRSILMQIPYFTRIQNLGSWIRLRSRVSLQSDAKKMAKIVFPVGIIAACALWIAGQGIQGTRGLDQNACSNECVESVGLCHLQRALFLLHGRDLATEECVRREFQRLDSLVGIDRILLGIDELDKVIANPSGIRVELRVVKLERAASKIELARLFLESNEIDKADSAMKEAGTAYFALLGELKDVPNRNNLLPTIVSGLLRCGMTLEAMDVLSKLPQSDPNRAYLMAEAYFSIGDRKNAAKYYENWLKLKCQSELLMLVNDEYGKRWSLLASSKPTRQDRCEQLPEDIRSRFEVLNQQFGHPNNLPKNNYPSVVFPAQADN